VHPSLVRKEGRGGREREGEERRERGCGCAACTRHYDERGRKRKRRGSGGDTKLHDTKLANTTAAARLTKTD